MLSCSFAHGPEELKIRLDLQKTKICEMWMRGNCHNVNCCKRLLATKLVHHWLFQITLMDTMN